MNMVATANSRTFAPDADLVLDAAGGDAGAFESLFRRHVQSAWRLAQAVAATKDDAAKATSDAFARLLRDARRGREAAAEQFRTQLLAAVYRNAATGPKAFDERDRRLGGVPATGGGPVGVGVGVTVPLTSELRVARAFRSLPTRWRAALWLLEVEGFDAVTAGTVLGVSSAAAVQLAKRGWSGLEQRVIQGGGQLPLPELAPVLTPAVAPLPTVLAARTEAKWRGSVSADSRWSAPLAGWLIERTSAPLKACAVGLCAMGIIAAALVGQGYGIARTSPAGQVAAPRTAGPSLGGTIDQGGAPQIPGAVTPTTVNAVGGTGAGGPGAGTTPVATPASATPALVSTPSAPGTPTTVVTATATTVALTPTTPTTVPVTTIPTIPTVTTTTLPPSSGPPPVVTAQPVIQTGLNTGPVAVGLGLGQTSCTGVNLLNLQIGCTPPTTGLSITVLGAPLIH